MTSPTMPAPPIILAPRSNIALYVVALLIMAALTLVAVIAVQVLVPAQSASLTVEIIGFAGIIIAAFIAALKSAEAASTSKASLAQTQIMHVSMNSNYDKLLLLNGEKAARDATAAAQLLAEATAAKVVIEIATLRDEIQKSNSQLVEMAKQVQPKE